MSITFIAHRGAPRSGRRENTVAAFQRAADSGRFAYIEMDVRRTRVDADLQMEAIVAHDPTADRAYDLQKRARTKRKYSGLPLASLTRQMIREDELDIPSLIESLRAISAHPVNLEVKNRESLAPMTEIIRQLVEQKTGGWDYQCFVISSRDWTIVSRAQQLLPEVGTALVYGFNNLFSNPLKLARTLDVRFINVNKFLAPFLGPILVFGRVKNRFAYTVNSAVGIRILTFFGINGFTTDSITLPEEFNPRI